LPAAGSTHYPDPFPAGGGVVEKGHERRDFGLFGGAFGQFLGGVHQLQFLAVQLVKITLDPVSSIPRTAAGKFRSVVSMVKNRE
jgi:hypothetical protein